MLHPKGASELSCSMAGGSKAVKRLLSTKGLTLNGSRYYDLAAVSALMDNLAQPNNSGHACFRAGYQVEALVRVITEVPLVLDPSEIYVRNPRSGDWFQLPIQFPDWGRRP